MRSHARLLKLGLDRDPISATRLLQSYARFPSLDVLASARQVFDAVPSDCRDPSLWAAMISAYARSHRPAQALRLFALMPRPTAFACASAARAAGSASEPSLGRAVHSLAIKLGFSSNIVVGTAILDMYSKCDAIVLSRTMFDEMPQRSAVTWNSMIAGYTIAGIGIDALELFYQLKCSEFELGVDEFAVASGLTACGGLGDLHFGIQIHGYLVTVGLESDAVVMNALANMYFRCGYVESAERSMVGSEVSVMSRLMMMKGYIFNERYDDAIRSIRHNSGFMEMVIADPTVVVSVLAACATLELPATGRQVHGLIVTMGLLENGYSSNVDIVILGGALIDMYCRCFSVREATTFFCNLVEKHISHWNSMIAGCLRNGLLEQACAYFDDMPERSLISWTTMISGYVQFGLPQKGLTLLARFYNEGGRGNCFTFATALNACGCLAALNAGKQIHAHALRMTTEAEGDHMVLETALIDMYSRSGSLNYAKKVFDRMAKKNVVSWTSMITGYAAHGLGLQAINVLEQMISMGIEPNEVTFIAVLGACSHCGLVEEGLGYFKLMREKYSIVPGGSHYACVVDMLGRAGRLEEAWNLVEEMKDVDMKYTKDIVGTGASMMGALLGGCQLHGNVQIGSKVAEKMLRKRWQPSDTYVGLSNVYAAADMWDEVYRVREEWRNHGFFGDSGHSRIQKGTLRQDFS